MKTIQVTCPCCNATFDACIGRKPRQLIEKTCKICSKPYQTYDDTSQFCSRRCNGINRIKRATAVEVAMYACYQDGESMETIARAYGITRQRVHIIFRRNGFKMRPVGRPAKRGIA
jgi:hypothetical protein